MGRMKEVLLDERAYLHDWRDACSIDYESLERLTEFLSVSEQINRCEKIIDRLMLHVCTSGLHGCIPSTVNELQTEVQVLKAQASAFARKF